MDSVMTLVYFMLPTHVTFKFELMKHYDLNYNRIRHFCQSDSAIAFFIINLLFCGFVSFDVNLCKNESWH